jgi:ribosomal protein L11 methyltransferase
MKEIRPSHPQQPPYENLYIYYLKGCVAEDPDLDGENFIGNWEEEGDSFLFFRQAADVLVAQVLARQSLTLSDRFEMTYDQWQGGALAPIQAGALQVVPPWLAEVTPAVGHRILLDPGVVFGSGTHPTTRDCLSAVQMAFRHHSVHRALDLGTGTGLLALAIARLGDCQVVAVDLNRLAVETAMQNVRRNHMAEQILVVQADANNFMDLPCDLVVSNIHYEVMRRIIAVPGFQKHKQFVLSGLLRSQARKIEQRLLQQSAKILRKWEREGTWYTFYGQNT